MTTSSMKSVFSLVAIVTPMVAQSDGPTVAAPLLGVVFDSSAGLIRPLTGIPASATLGDPFEAKALKSAAPVAGLGFAIGVDADSGESVLISASGTTALPGTQSGAARIAVSPLGKAAALYFEESHTVQIVTGLPARPRVARELTPRGTPSALAVSDDGEVVLMAAAQEDGESVLLDQGQGLGLLVRASHVLAMEFFPESHNGLFAESAANAVSLIQVAGGFRVLPLSDERDGTSEVVGLAGSTDGSAVFIATRSGRIAVRDINKGEQTLVDCPCEPSSLARLRGPGVFRLNGIGDGPVWLLDAGGEQPRVLFVAAGAQRGEQ